MSTVDPPCQTTGGAPPAWSDHPRADAKDALAREVAACPDGVPVPEVARDVLGDGDDVEHADHRLALRFFENHPEWFETNRRDGCVWVEPTLEASRRLHSTASKHTVGRQDGDGVAASNGERFLECRRTVDSSEEWGDLVGAFGGKRRATEGRFICLEDTFTGSYTLIPYATRFDSERRVGETRARFGGAWSRAGESFDRAVVATLTTDPSRYESLSAACEGVMDDVNALRDWVSYSPSNGPPRIGDRVPSIVVPEFTGRGVPHVHVVFFGVGWVARHEALSGYWNGNRGRGEVVWFDPLVNRDGRWRWARRGDEREHPSDEVAGRSPRGYLSEGIEALATSAAHSAEDVCEAAARLRGGESLDDVEGGRALAEAALYWASGLSVFTCSPSLRESSDAAGDSGRSRAPDGTVLPADGPPRWRYVGTARWSEFPAHIRDRARVVDRPPP